MEETQLSARAVIVAAVRLAFRTWPILFAAVLITTVPIVALEWLNLENDALVVAWFAFFVSAVVGSLFFVSILIIRAAGQQVLKGRFLVFLAVIFFQALAEYLLVSELEELPSADYPSIAFVLVLVGGFIFLRLLLAVPILFVEGSTVGEALGGSWKRTQGRTLDVFLSCSPFLALFAVGFIFPEIYEGPLPERFALLALDGLATMLLICASVVLYLHLPQRPYDGANDTNPI